MAQSTADLNLTPIDEDYREDLHENAFSSRGCCCFLNFWCFKSGKSDDWERISTEQESLNRSLWDKEIGALKKVREWSEVVAGPKWKTFIRRFSRTGGRARPGKFGYDPLSYALNFDDGLTGQHSEIEFNRVARDFSLLYAATPVQNDQ
ncbi:hypothetical protein PHJA_002821600 [Phtheirospermum japonicum]|uniref:Uncharacterized protein n=1 Tax=Phtheirospermum japonicum TaxID=374723 RepID=A0A830DJ56_9LAMI|nr:hypothetical protein PHJA_002821600 [Phtheirospermum japonicum]